MIIASIHQHVNAHGNVARRGKCARNSWCVDNSSRCEKPEVPLYLYLLRVSSTSNIIEVLDDDALLSVRC